MTTEEILKEVRGMSEEELVNTVKNSLVILRKTLAGITSRVDAPDVPQAMREDMLGMIQALTKCVDIVEDMMKPVGYRPEKLGEISTILVYELMHIVFTFSNPKELVMHALKHELSPKGGVFSSPMGRA